MGYFDAVIQRVYTHSVYYVRDKGQETTIVIILELYIPVGWDALRVLYKCTEAE